MFSLCVFWWHSCRPARRGLGWAVALFLAGPGAFGAPAGATDPAAGSAGGVAASVSPGGAAAAELPASWVRREFAEVDTLFANPGQGWMSSQRTPRPEPRFPCSVVYLRFLWTDIEPEEGRYNWQLIDDVIAAWKPRGATVAMRVMTCSAHSKGYYASPPWLFAGGCRGFEYVEGGGDPTKGGQRLTRIEPDYADPRYLEKHGAFLRAFGARYDGRPEVEFLDIGSYGMWGEWHTKHPAPAEVRRQIVSLYRAAFPRTPLVFMTDDAEVLPHALALGAGLRRDGVGSPWHEQNWIGSKKYAGVPEMATVWQRAPVVFEWYGDYAYLQSRQWSFAAAVEFILRNHANIINDNIGRVPPEARPQLERLARLAGARFVLREVAHPATVAPGSVFTLRQRWANVGVGRLFRPYVLRYGLIDGAGKTIATTTASADPRAWLPGEHALTVAWTLPATLPAGDYTVTVALVLPEGSARPFRLAFAAPERGDGYEIGRLQVR